MTTRTMTSTGDAAVWIAPRSAGSGSVPVLRFTNTRTNHSIAVQLSRDDLARIRDTAAAILDASPDDIEGWLDDAAEALHATVAGQRP
ncbi:hypothetical protein A5719_03345 [Mycolicibacterium peregrinum]|uniref:hypothetical protein n=1 Tax=Mycolicibacterium peregrinum TaxID=43304 RepID=UPI0007EB1A4C|nr:hypothetical protein [Mycolicibacterium peregrinum]OBF42574.1 hypothetical protein A5719_03345 [Mycolicibacterium peregrinum]